MIFCWIKMHFAFWFCRFATWIDDRCVTLHVDQPIIFRFRCHITWSWTKEFFFLLIKYRKRGTQRFGKWNWIESFSVWNCHSIDSINSRLFFIHVFFVFTIRCRWTQENPQDWHGQMGICVWARTKHDNNINKLKYVPSLYDFFR